MRDPSRYPVPKLEWYSLQTGLERTPSDVVIFLDSCNAAGAVGSSNVRDGGKTELIAACGIRETTLATNEAKISFTSFLARALIELGTNGNMFSITELHEKVLASISRHDESEMLSTPVYVRLNGKGGQAGIQMKALEGCGNRDEEVFNALNGAVQN